MPLAPGTRLGAYEVLGPLGAGGMGEVYRARDTRLDRMVALKLVADEFATDPERMARFEREARLLASLHHPHIAVLHGLESDAGRRFIVMECVDGDSLATRLARGALPVDEAIEVARQIATALEAAHEGGVVHRDLKPANVMLTPAGVAKVLDFGLARGATGSPSDTSLSASPTMTYAATAGGVILGTAAYMSPEQARGKPVDRRTDIWAFGCVLFECLTGRQAFEGETVSDLIASILKGGIDWDALPADTPPRVRELLHRCLERDPRQRLRDIGEARLILEQPMAGPAATAAPAPVAARGWPAPLAIGVAIVLAAVAGLAAWTLKPAPEPPTTWTHMAPPEGVRFQMLAGGQTALSSDGRWFATVAVDTGGSRRILVRDFETGGTRLLTGSEEATYPFWSPDGRSLGAFKEGRLMRFDLESGSVTALATAPDGRGGTWSRDDVIVFAPTSSGGLSAVSASGGEVRALVADSLERGYRFPHFLPDGRHFVCAYFDSAAAVAMEVRALDGGKPRPLPLGSGISGNAYFAEGRLFYWQERALRARPFDPGRLAFTGEAVTVASPVAASPPRARADFAVAEGGAIVYRPSSGGGRDLIAVRERSGRVLSRIEFDSSMEDLELSPDGRKVAVSVRPPDSEGKVDVWIHDLERSGSVRLTFSGQDDDPVWSPDGGRLAWQGPQGIRMKASSGAGSEALVHADRMDMVPIQWAPDGRTLLFTATTQQGVGGLDAIWALELGDSVARPILSNRVAHVRFAQISPDLQWIAYASSESRRFEVYIQDYPGLRGRWQVSTRGGGMPRWRSDGHELYFLDYDGRTHAASVEARDSSLTVGQPEVLFDTQMGSHLSNRAFAWDVDATGSRFYCLEPLQRQDVRQALTVIRNWRPARGGR